MTQVKTVMNDLLSILIEFRLRKLCAAKSQVATLYFLET